MLDNPLTHLAVAAAAWFLLHRLVAGSGLRFRIVERIGEPRFRGLFALLSLLSLYWLVTAFQRAPCDAIWAVPLSAFWLPLAVMPFALFLLAGAFTVKNPAAVAAESALEQAVVSRGVLRITRHPFLWAVALWSSVHLLVVGTSGALLFFGTMLLTALNGTRDIDRKRLRTHPDAWRRYQQSTSNFPFLAVISRRNRLVLRELMLPILIAAGLTGLLLVVHQPLFRVSPLP